MDRLLAGADPLRVWRDHRGMTAAMLACATDMPLFDVSFRNGYYSFVKRASITDVKNSLSAFIDQVRHGDAIVIEDRGVPVARLEPMLAPGRNDTTGRTARLVRQGLVKPALTAPPRRVLATGPPAPRGRVTLSQALLDERRSGR